MKGVVLCLAADRRSLAGATNTNENPASRPAGMTRLLSQIAGVSMARWRAEAGIGLHQNRGFGPVHHTTGGGAIDMRILG